MAPTQRPLFREQALQKYMQKQDKDVLPRFIAPPLFLFAWILLLLGICACLLAWGTGIPIFVDGEGIVPAKTNTNKNPTIEVLLPATYASHIHAGAPVLLITGEQQNISSHVLHAEPGILSPSAARQRYGLGATETPTEPSIVLAVATPPELARGTYEGSILRAQVQVGTRRILTLLPIFDRLAGE